MKQLVELVNVIPAVNHKRVWVLLKSEVYIIIITKFVVLLFLVMLYVKSVIIIAVYKTL